MYQKAATPKQRSTNDFFNLTKKKVFPVFKFRRIHLWEETRGTTPRFVQTAVGADWNGLKKGQGGVKITVYSTHLQRKDSQNKKQGKRKRERDGGEGKTRLGGRVEQRGTSSPLRITQKSQLISPWSNLRTGEE